MFFALDVWTNKNWISVLPERESACSPVIIPASAITSNDIKIKEIISNFCRPSGFAACRSSMSFACRITRLGKRKIWDWLLAVWGSLSTCLRVLKSSLSFLEARAVNYGGRLYDWSTSKKSIWTIFFLRMPLNIWEIHPRLRLSKFSDNCIYFAECQILPCSGAPNDFC